MPTEALEAAFPQRGVAHAAGAGAGPHAASAEMVTSSVSAHLLDLPAAASGAPPLRLPLPQPGQRVWIRGADPAFTSGGGVVAHGGVGGSSGGGASTSAVGASSAADGPSTAATQPSCAQGGEGGAQLWTGGVSQLWKEEAQLWVFGLGLGDPHAVLAVSADGVVQIEAMSEGSLCVLNGDLLAPGAAFTLHHGDRLLLGSERLFLVALWKPQHDGSHGPCGTAALAHSANGHVSSTPGSPTLPITPLHRGHSYSHDHRVVIAAEAAAVSSDGGGGSFAFRAEAESHLHHAEAELLDATGLRFHELHRLRRLGLIVRSAWRRATGSLLAPAAAHAHEHALRRMETEQQLAAAMPWAHSPPLDPRAFHNEFSPSGAADGTARPLGTASGGGSPPSHRSGMLFSGSSLSHAAAFGASALAAAAPVVDMIDAAISARPLEEAAMLQHVLDSAELQRRSEDCLALDVELKLVKAEAAEVAEENRWVREALDESRQRLSTMAEELAATKAALRHREEQLHEAKHGQAKAARGGGAGLLGCMGSREPPPSQPPAAHAPLAPKTFVVPIAGPQLAKPPMSYVVSVTPRLLAGPSPSASPAQQQSLRMREPSAAVSQAFVAVSSRRNESTADGNVQGKRRESSNPPRQHPRASRRGRAPIGAGPK